MAKAVNPLWNYKPCTQRIKLLLHGSLNGAAFLAWHFCYPHRFPDPGLSATQHLALKILQASLKPIKVPWKILQKLWSWGAVPVPPIWDQQGALTDAFLVLGLSTYTGKDTVPTKKQTFEYIPNTTTLYIYTYIYECTKPQLSGWKKKIIQGQVLASQQKNTFEFKRPFAEGIIISRIQQVLFFSFFFFSSKG